MGILRYLFERNIEKKISIFLFIGFFVFYFALNLKYVMYLSSSYVDMLKFSPFADYSFFLLNLFNFDPSMYNTSVSPIHPFKNFLTSILNFIWNVFDIQNPFERNFFFLIVQSILNALNVVFLFLILKLLKIKTTISTLISMIFGVSTYSIVTSFIPDSYAYVQFIIIISLYLLLKTDNKILYIVLGILNFAITSTNVIPFLCAVFIKDIFKHSFKKAVIEMMKYIICLIVICLIITLIQFLIYGYSWWDNFLLSIDKGGVSYTELFSFEKHWYSFYLLFINPIIMSNVELVDYNLMAFVSAWDFSNHYIFKIIPLFFIVTFLWLFQKLYKEKEIWIVTSYIVFSVILHLVVGFGLAAISYDLFLYAGHYISVIFIGVGLFFRSIAVKKIYLYLLIIIFLIVTSNNICKYLDLYNNITTTFEELESNSKILDDSLEWELFSSHSEFKIVRTNLGLLEKDYIVYNDDTKLNDYNADYFFKENLSDIYVNGYLYISISNEDSSWGNNYVPSKEEIKKYFSLKKYKLVY